MSWQRNTALAILAAVATSGAVAQQPNTSAKQPAASQPQHSAVQSDPALTEFANRVNTYLDERKQHAGTMPDKPTSNARKLKETREQMRTRIEQNRANAKQGEIFGPPVDTYFRKQIAKALNGPDGKRVMTSLKRAEPVKQVDVQINKPYPSGVPLQSMPPTLLMVLPQLPKELQYRIVGSRLVLLDIEPNLVVDVLPNAIPAA